MAAFATNLRNGLILAILLGSPWLFACVHPGALIFIKSLGTLLGASFLLLKFLRPVALAPSPRELLLAGCTILLLAYAAIRTPQSIDPRVSAYALWGYATLAALFWSIRDWIREEPAAARNILMAVLVNAAAIALAGLAHRLTGSRKVLWIYQPEVASRYYIFGPFEYRATASQFFNLLWPAALGLYVQQLLSASQSSWPKRIALPATAVLLLTAPIVTSSRGGLLMAFLGLIVFLAALLVSRSLPRIAARRVLLIVMGAAVLFTAFGIKPVKKRWNETRSIQKFLNLQGRLAQNENSWRIIADHPWWGVGPGAYEPAFRVYQFPNAFKPARNDPREQAAWDFFYAKAHNDWLQTLAEWGAPATALILFALLAAALPGSRDRIDSVGIGLRIGLLITILHGAFDYPFQNLAILCAFTATLALGNADSVKTEGQAG